MTLGQGISGDSVTQGQGISGDSVTQGQGISGDSVTQGQGISADSVTQGQGISPVTSAVPRQNQPPILHTYISFAYHRRWKSLLKSQLVKKLTALYGPTDSLPRLQ